MRTGAESLGRQNLLGLLAGAEEAFSTFLAGTPQRALISCTVSPFTREARLSISKLESCCLRFLMSVSTIILPSTSPEGSPSSVEGCRSSKSTDLVRTRCFLRVAPRTARTTLLRMHIWMCSASVRP